MITFFLARVKLAGDFLTASIFHPAVDVTDCIVHVCSRWWCITSLWCMCV